MREPWLKAYRFLDTSCHVEQFTPQVTQQFGVLGAATAGKTTQHKISLHDRQIQYRFISNEQLSALWFDFRLLNDPAADQPLPCPFHTYCLNF